MLGVFYVLFIAFRAHLGAKDLKKKILLHYNIKNTKLGFYALK
jgi:hypothetical protein